MEHELVVVGAGQAGLAMSRELARRDLEHVVLERGRVGDSWRSRWESFCLVTPNWTMQLPDQPYDGDDPDAFDSRDEIVSFLERYAARFDVPVHEGVDVRRCQPCCGEGESHAGLGPRRLDVAISRSRGWRTRA